MNIKQKLKLLPGIRFYLHLKNLQVSLKNSNTQVTNAAEYICQLHQSYLVNFNQDHRYATFSIAKESDYIISLTSYGKRVNTVHKTIQSLLCQSVKVDKVILWLSKDEFHSGNLPSELSALQAFGLKIKFCEDLLSFKKLVPAFIEFPDHHIITFDDDIIYPHDQVEKLITKHKEHPDSIICHQARKVVLNSNDEPKKYEEWQYVGEQAVPTHMILPIGLGGVLYPANSLDKEVVKSELFLNLCPNADDLWFKVMALKSKTKAVQVDNAQRYQDYLFIPSSQDNSLWQTNKNMNDQQLKNILSNYPDITFKGDQ